MLLLIRFQGGAGLSPPPSHLQQHSSLPIQGSRPVHLSLFPSLSTFSVVTGSVPSPRPHSMDAPSCYFSCFSSRVEFLGIAKLTVHAQGQWPQASLQRPLRLRNYSSLHSEFSSLFPHAHPGSRLLLWTSAIRSITILPGSLGGSF